MCLCISLIIRVRVYRYHTFSDYQKQKPVKRSINISLIHFQHNYCIFSSINTTFVCFNSEGIQEGWLAPTERASVSAHFGLPWLRPWDNRGKFYMDGKRIQCCSNASQHVPIYLQPFTSYSEIFVGNCNFFLPFAFNVPGGGVPIGILHKRLVHRKLE